MPDLLPHSFWRRFSSSSELLKVGILKIPRISSGLLPLTILAMVLQPRSMRGLISRKSAACMMWVPPCIAGGRRTYPDNVEESLVVNLHEHLIPFHNVIGSLARAVIIIVMIQLWVVPMILTPGGDLLENKSSNLQQNASINQCGCCDKAEETYIRDRNGTSYPGEPAAHSPKSAIMFRMKIERWAATRPTITRWVQTVTYHG